MKTFLRMKSFQVSSTNGDVISAWSLTTRTQPTSILGADTSSSLPLVDFYEDDEDAGLPEADDDELRREV